MENHQSDTAGKRQDIGQSRPGKVQRSVLAKLAFVAALSIGSWFILSEESPEQLHPDWQHVAAAGEASAGGSHQLIHIDQQGGQQTVPSLELSADDIDKTSTRQIYQSLQRGDFVTASALLQNAQTLPTAAQNSDVRPPVITPDSDLAIALKERRQELYQISLFDCCDEDGDVVEVLVNGSSFAIVPISHSGTTLTIPLQSGHNKVIVRGVKDGGGGVTVSFSTSQGDYFARYLKVGEEHQMGVIVQ